MTATYLDYETPEGTPMTYYIDVEVVDQCKIDGAYGEYHPTEEKTYRPKVVIKRGCRPFTIQHEALHACIDFFRTEMPEDFNEIFDSKCKFGEEAFIHYYETFYTIIKKAVRKELK